MNNTVIANEPIQNSRQIASSKLILWAFVSVFFPRLLDLAGAPSIVNFIHFFTVPLACLVALSNFRSRNRDQVTTVNSLIIGLTILFIVIVLSALVNQAGYVNVLIDFMLLGEPFILIVAIASLTAPPQNIIKLKNFIYGCFWFHLASIYIQKYILKVDTWAWLGMVGHDRIQGVFLRSGAGHVVGASVSMTLAISFIYLSRRPLWLRLGVVLAGVWNIVIADAKQVLLVFMVAAILLFFTKLKDPVETVKYLLLIIVLWLIFSWCMENVSAFRGFNTWLDPELYGKDGEATLLKSATFRIVPTYYDSILNWFFGLGPGHTVGRLGGWMFRDYSELLLPLGATQHIASKEVWRAVAATFIGDRSSMFSPLFGWAGIWGDLGFVGLASYFYLGWLVWSRVCYHELSKFLLLTIIAFGLVFSQMEEPGYMLSVSAIIGLQYREKIMHSTEIN